MNTVKTHKGSENEGIHLTQAAQDHIISYLKKNPKHRGIRFFVKKTGCSGLAYAVDYLDTPTEEDIVVKEIEGYLICFDKKSHPFLKNTEVDYVKEGLNQKFTFKNPNQTGECGCGESFTVD